MPLVVVSGGVTPARLFRGVRNALGLSVNEMQDALCLPDRGTVLRIERGQLSVHGPTWVALGYMLREQAAASGGASPARDVAEEARDEALLALERDVSRYVAALRNAARAGRDATEERRRLRP
jgi:hypothetical protein